MSTLLEDIEVFLASNTEVSPTAFGEAALNDRHLVHQLRKGKRRMWPETERKVRNFIASYRRAPTEDAA